MRLLTKLLLASTLLFACGSGSKLNIPGVDGPTLDITSTHLNINATFTGLNLNLTQTTFPLPEINNSSISVGAASSRDPSKTGTYIDISISIQSLIDDADFLESQPSRTLPGGRPLPGVATGGLPSVAFTVTDSHISEHLNGTTFYVGSRFFGVFVPIRFTDLPSGIVSAEFSVGPIRGGTLSMVGPDANDENAGFLLLLDLTDQVRSELRKILENPDHLKKLKNKYGRNNYDRNRYGGRK